jgi:hypothetical protein
MLALQTTILLVSEPRPFPLLLFDSKKSNTLMDSYQNMDIGGLSLEKNSQEDQMRFE